MPWPPRRPPPLPHLAVSPLRRVAAERSPSSAIPTLGKSTLTEALALHARAITEAGAVHGKAGSRATVSDWMEMEKARGISITSTVLQLPFRTCVINLLDTPGHADFSEDTYRVLTAVDSAVTGDDWDHAVEESELLSADGSDYDREQFLSGAATPVLFTSAALNFGVNQLLDVLVELAPPPSGALDVDGARRATESPFSAYVFKVQAGMDSAHRDRIAYARVCSGTFERGDVLTHAATGKPFVTKYAQSVFGQQRATLDTAWPGDVIGLANAAALSPGDTMYRDVPVHYPPIPSFSPEHFAAARGADPSKHKQFRRGITSGLSRWKPCSRHGVENNPDVKSGSLVAAEGKDASYFRDVARSRDWASKPPATARVAADPILVELHGRVNEFINVSILLRVDGVRVMTSLSNQPS